MASLFNKKWVITLLAVSGLAAVALSISLFWPPLKQIEEPIAWRQVSIRDLSVRAEIASSALARYRGLSQRPQLAPQAGMLFVFPESEKRAFVMRDMSFPLDIIFINQGRIVNIAADLPISDPDRLYFSAGPADRVLEINAGLSAQYGLSPGDEVKIESYEK